MYFMQSLVHSRFGAVAYALPRLWTFHFAGARLGFEGLTASHHRVLRHTPGSSAIRALTDEAMLQEAYGAGNAMVSNAVRAVQHLADEIESHHGVQPNGNTVEERIKCAASLFSTETWNTGPVYGGLDEIKVIRDALEHPRGSNTSSTDANGWDGVPLAWMLSDRSLEAWCRFERWFSKLSDTWDEYRRTTSQPGTVTVERGIESLLQVKKPPRESD